MLFIKNLEFHVLLLLRSSVALPVKRLMPCL